MRKLASRGLYLEQLKEPAISQPIKHIDDTDTVFLPVSDDICVSQDEVVKKGKLVSHGKYPDSIDSFSSIDGMVSAIGTFDCEKYDGKKFLKVTGGAESSKTDVSRFIGKIPDDGDIMFAAQLCGVINNTDKKPLGYICDAYPNGVKNLVIDAVDDEPYVSSKTAQLIYRAQHVESAIDAINRIFKAENVRIDVYGRMDVIKAKIPHRLGKYPVNAVRQTYPVSKLMKSDSETVYIDIGALLSFYYSAVQRLAWTYTVVTVAGDCVKNPCNLEVPVGTPIGEILGCCGLEKNPKTIVLGGSMTGYEANGTDIPVLKSTKAILAFNDELSCKTDVCIGCGKCIDVCPEELLPYYIYKYSLEGNTEKLYRLSAEKCNECGCCSYICPAKIDLRQYVKQSRRNLLKEMWKNEQNGQDSESPVSEE